MKKRGSRKPIQSRRKSLQMKKGILFVSALTAIIFVLTVLSCSSEAKKEAAENNTTSTAATTEQPVDVVKKGEHLVTIMGCNDCHSPKKMGAMGPEIIPELMLSGYPADRPVVKFDSKLIKEGFGMFYPDLTAAAGPWGVSFAANLTPDSTGIGNWTEEQLKIALTQGKAKGLPAARTLLPPMPWQNYSKLTDDEVHAIYSYIKTLKPVRNVVPEPITPDKM